GGAAVGAYEGSAAGYWWPPRAGRDSPSGRDVMEPPGGRASTGPSTANETHAEAEGSRMSQACARWRGDIGAYIVGALSPAEAARVKRHLRGCAACRAEYQDLIPVRDWLRRPGPPDCMPPRPPPGRPRPDPRPPPPPPPP